MKRLHALVGHEHDLAEVCRELKAVVRSLSPVSVGALQVTCSDESEHECSDAFHRGFAQELLPRLKYGSRVPFRIANPGARYEWGAARIAEEHFATPEAARGFKVLVAKINGHVSLTRQGSQACFGSMERYGSESTYCGAIHALLADADQPFVRALRDTLRAEDVDRVATLLDPARVDPAVRVLFGALVNARLQARFLVQDIQEHAPRTPTLYLVLHGVTLNKPGPDTELLGGVYTIDRRDKPRDRYRGLGDDPAAYVLEQAIGRVQVRDPHVDTERPARDHRRLAHDRLAAWRRRAAHVLPAVRDALTQAERGTTGGRRAATAVLQRLLSGLAAVAPIPGALVLAAQGLAGVYELHRLGQAGAEEVQRERAQDVIATVRERLARLSADEAAEVLDALVAQLRDVAGTGTAGA